MLHHTVRFITFVVVFSRMGSKTTIAVSLRVHRMLCSFMRASSDPQQSLDSVLRSVLAEELKKRRPRVPRSLAGRFPAFAEASKES